MIKVNVDDEDPNQYILSVDEPVRVTPFGQGGIAVYRGLTVDENQQPAMVYVPEDYLGVEEMIAPEAG